MPWRRVGDDDLKPRDFSFTRPPTSRSWPAAAFNLMMSIVAMASLPSVDHAADVAIDLI